jgi:hypothetical protein
MDILAEVLTLGLPVNEKAARLAHLLAKARDKPLPTRPLYQRLSAAMCWDAALYCAWKVRAVKTTKISDQNVTSGHLSTNCYQHIFKPVTNTVHNNAEIMDLPLGCLIGFIGRLNLDDPNSGLVLKHVMIYVGNGRAVGSKSHCVFNARGDWEELELRAFFATEWHQRGVILVYQPLTGQNLY